MSTGRKALITCYLVVFAYLAISVFLYGAIQNQFVAKEAQRGAQVDSDYLARVVLSMTERSSYVVVACVFLFGIEVFLYAKRRGLLGHDVVNR